jgi:thiol:disulfide interchange protein/DsbC/DsbD-like thiol-disulfide interchange protein
MKRLTLLVSFVLLMGLATPALARESAPVTSERATVSLVSDTDAVAAGKAFRLGLRFRLAPGWHTYWQNPGDAGEKPDLTLNLPSGAHAGPIHWPTPERLAEGPVMAYAYSGEVLLPLTVTPAAGAGGAHITAHANWLVCSKICVPEEGDFRLDLAAGQPSPSAEAPLFAAAEARMPRPSPWPAHIAPDGRLTVEAQDVEQAWFLPAQWGLIDQAAPQALQVRGDEFSLALRPGPQFQPTAPLPGVLVVRDSKGAERSFEISATPGPAQPAASGVPLRQALLFAALGGLILNLMPCVFPVLAMKAVSLASGAADRRVRSHALSYTAGVLIAFGAIAGTLLAARAAGSAAGWGFQYQSPVFVAATAWTLFVVGLNLSGVFQVGGSFAGSGQGLASRGGHVGSFFTGLLAVVVATPCTAPLMGGAIAAGLAAPPLVTVLVFLTMGLGLSAPYLLLAVFPRLAHVAPRPGRWMEILKQGLAFPMYAAAGWLVWVISQETGPAGVLATVAGLVLLGFAGWALGISQTLVGQGRRAGQTASLAAVLAAVAVLSGMTGVRPAAMAMNEGGAEPFSVARLAQLRAEGRPVFVNMTAAWCVTCLVNERVALAPAAVREEFASHHVAYLKGDWTRQDPEITSFLRQHGRDGVPLYVFFRPGAADPDVLPQILTERTVLNEVDHLGS